LTALNKKGGSQSKIKGKCQDLTEQDQRDKDPGLAGKWVNVQTMIQENPGREHPREGNRDVEWEEAWEEAQAWQPAELRGGDSGKETGWIPAETPGKIKYN